MKILILISLLFAANLLFHLEALAILAAEGYGYRLAVAIVTLLIIVIGGRIIPSFTRNWLARRGDGRLPVPFARFDMLCIAAAVLALASWTIVPEHMATLVLCLLAAALHMARMIRWTPERTWREPLVWSLHVGYLFVPLGFLLTALAVPPVELIAATTALHAWTAGAMGVMTMAVMTRATLGHSGRPLVSSPALTTLYLLIIAAVLMRLGADLDMAPAWGLHAAGGLWIAAFAGFALMFGGMLALPKRL
jgi:uncharacterized protein involved in response to NO